MKTVFFTVCHDYAAALPTAVARVFDQSQWLSAESLGGKKVLVKPNMLTDRTPEQAVTTHPEFLRQVIRNLRQRGAQITVGDSPASAANLKAVWEKTGIAAVCKQEGVALISFEQAGSKVIRRGGYEFSIAKPALATDIILNLPKVKSHSLTVLTAAVKNLYGVIPGYTKTILHRNHPKISDFGMLVKSIHSCLPPVWSIADGVIGMEGQGPANGTPVSLGFIAASQNPFALDIAICQTLGIAPARVPYLGDSGDLAANAPLIKGDFIRVESFKIPAGAHLLSRMPVWLIRNSTGLIWVRPAFSDEKCVQCGLCVKACPVEALILGQDRKAPHLNTELCITCSCCHEVCPADAIQMRQSSLLRLAGAFKGLR
ncbi:MAG: DUF362 domain-containing protein [Kiritimatiellia bacterium]